MLESSNELTRVNTKARQTKPKESRRLRNIHPNELSSERPGTTRVSYIFLQHRAESKRLRNIHPNGLSSERPGTTRKYYIYLHHRAESRRLRNIHPNELNSERPGMSRTPYNSRGFSPDLQVSAGSIACSNSPISTTKLFPAASIGPSRLRRVTTAPQIFS